MTMFKDYYAELGIPRGASEQTIRQAYRTLARQYHPDVNPDTQEAEERFKAISEAYRVLSDPHQRKRYNSLYRRYRRWVQYGNPDDLDWSKWQALASMPSFDFFFNVLDAVIGLEEKEEDPYQKRPGDDLEVAVIITLEEAFRGIERTVQVDKKRAVTITIPPGVQSNMELRLAGQGSPGTVGVRAGDLYIVVQEQPHPLFQRQDDDLYTDVSVDMFTALIGGEVTIATLDGPAELEIPPRTPADKLLCLEGRGMPHMKSPHQRGNLYARVKLSLPEPMSAEELEILQRMARARNTSPMRR
jgi:curved DNA-binding protein